MSKRHILILAVLAVCIFVLGGQLATAKPVEVKVGNSQISFLPLIFTSDAESPPETRLAKAGVSAWCSDTDSAIFESFNNVNDEEITITNGDWSGECTIDFGLPGSEYYIVATGETSGILFRGVSVQPFWPSVHFYCWDPGDNGSSIDSIIHAIVY
jgi:hypothetical protein